MKKLIEDIRMPVHAQHRARLAVIENEDMSGVRRKTEEYLREIGKKPTAHYLDAGIYALRQYYAVALLDPRNAHAVSARVDPFWHAHILHTEDYVIFCERVVGKYMHHTPLDHSKMLQVENVRALYQLTLERLTQLFHTVNGKFWSNDISDAAMICFHKLEYPLVDAYRLFEHDPARGTSHAFTTV